MNALGNCTELALFGGVPVRAKGWQEHCTLGPEEKDAVLRVMESGFLSLFEGAHAPEKPFSFWGGPAVQALEAAWRQYYGVPHAVSVNSATSGLYAAVGALGLGYGDEIIVSPFTMSACAAAPLIYGAIPIFADVDEDTGCLDPEAVTQRITPRTKAILVVHQFGNVAQMDRLMDIAKEHRLKIIEDCAQAHGASCNGRLVGTLGDIGVFSLNVNKTIQTGEGGVCITKDDDLHYRLALIRNHAEAVVQQTEVRDITNLIGFNYRLTELQAAIGIEQLKRLDEFNSVRMEYAAYLSHELEDMDCFVPMSRCEDTQNRNTAYCFAFRYLADRLGGCPREDMVRALCAEGARFGGGYVEPLYFQPLYRRKWAYKNGYPFTAPENRLIQTNYHAGSCPNAERLHAKEIVISDVVRSPHTMEDMRQLSRALRKVAGCLQGNAR